MINRRAVRFPQWGDNVTIDYQDVDGRVSFSVRQIVGALASDGREERSVREERRSRDRDLRFQRDKVLLFLSYTN